MITLDRLTVTFKGSRGAIHAVRELSLDVAEGEFFGIVGESGSGKSTVLRALAGLVPPSAGRMVVAGAELGRHRSRAQRRTLQMVFQDPYGSLHPRHTVESTLREPLAIHGLPDAERRVHDALIGVDLAPALRSRYPHQLSGGQRQRVAIARALILSPPVLLLDEPTSALDVSVQAEVLNLINAVRAKRRLTCLLVSHDLAVVAHMCERIAVMRQGALVEVLTADVLRSGEAREPYSRELIAASRGYRRPDRAA